MNSSGKIAAIVNPRARGGLAGKRWPRIAAALERRLGPVDARFTDAPGGGIRIARQLLEEGAELIIAVGGDGTVNEAANGFLESDAAVRTRARLGILPLGTGGDLRRTLGIPARLEDAIEILASGVPVAIDAGKIVFSGVRGKRAQRYFVNLVSFGMGGEVASRASRAPRFLGGRAAFFLATLGTFFGYRGKTIRLRLDGALEDFGRKALNIAVGNGRFHGGGMHPCPRALVNDGLLDVTFIEFMGWFELARDVHYLYSDDVYRHPKTRFFRARTVSAESDDPVSIEVDGEPLGELPAEITVVPASLRVMVARDSKLRP